MHNINDHGTIFNTLTARYVNLLSVVSGRQLWSAAAGGQLLRAGNKYFHGQCVKCKVEICRNVGNTVTKTCFLN